jgi:TPR repeat protein
MRTTRWSAFALFLISCVALAAQEARGWLGVEISNPTKAEASHLGLLQPRGAFVVLSRRDGPAASAGVKGGDLILSVNDIEVANTDALVKIVSAVPPGTSVRVRVNRAGTEQTIAVVVGARPAQFPPASMDELLEAAASGSGGAMYLIGLRYAGGQGVLQDYQQARQWYEKAAAKGDAAAFNELGVLYAKGDGVAKDIAQARHWYEKAAAAGDQWGLNNLGWLYYDGNGVRQDYQQARSLFEKAAAAGNVNSMYGLGLMLNDGKGGRQDYESARRWFEKSAGAGHVSAMNNLGLLYEKGRGVRQDFEEARHWYEKAADAKNGWAMNQIGIFYFHGRGVRRDLNEARRWFEKAAAAGEEWGRKNVQMMDRRQSRRAPSSRGGGGGGFDTNACLAQVGAACMGQCAGNANCYYSCNSLSVSQCYR